MQIARKLSILHSIIHYSNLMLCITKGNNSIFLAAFNICKRKEDKRDRQ